jgi:hypothetical protein
VDPLRTLFELLGEIVTGFQAARAELPRRTGSRTRRHAERAESIKGIEVTPTRGGSAVVGVARIEPALELSLSIEKRSSALGRPDRRVVLDRELHRAVLVQARERKLAAHCVAGEARASLLRLASSASVLSIDDRRARVEVPADRSEAMARDLVLLIRGLIDARASLPRADHSARVGEEWSRAARLLDAQFDGDREELCSSGPHGELRIRTELVKDAWCTRAEYTLARELPFQFQFGERATQSLWDRLRHSVDTFDAKFDSTFFLRGDPHDLAGLFAEEARARLLALRPEVDELALDRCRLQATRRAVLESCHDLLELANRMTGLIDALVPKSRARSAYRQRAG